MATITRTPKYSFTVPVYAPCISPDSFAGKTLKEIGELEVWEGNRRKKLKQLFDIKGKTADTPEEITIKLSGNLWKVRRIGEEMTAGKILIDGDAGLHLGVKMRGGTITVKGNADSWLGSQMRGGTIEVMGNAKDYVGGAYRGSGVGMRGGTIIVHGNAGYDVGEWMRGGFIKIMGNVGAYTGVHMQGGTILVQGDSEGRIGALMKGGKIVLMGKIDSILPSFTIQDLKKRTKVEGEAVEGPFYVFIGDLTEDGSGKLFISKKSNPHLSFYERLI